MSASVAIELDTRPPDIHLGTPFRLGANSLRVPYTVSPDTADIEVSLEVVGGATLTTAVDSEYVTCDDVPDDAISLHLELTATDDVGNTGSLVLDFNAVTYEIDAMIRVSGILTGTMKIEPLLQGAVHVRGGNG